MKHAIGLYIAIFLAGISGSCFAAEHKPQADKRIETREQLLAGINAWLKQYDQPTLTMEDIILRIAQRENFHDPDELFEQLLKDLVKKRRFKNPIYLLSGQANGIMLSEDFSSRQTLRLPSHYTLDIQILTMPWGTVDGGGHAMRVDSHEIPIAYALKANARKAKTTHTR